MKLNLPTINVGKPLLARDIPVFPIYLDVSSGPSSDYILAAEARKIGVFSMEEIRERQEVSWFRASNTDEKPVLLLWREPLKSRARLGTTLLVPPKTVLTIPPWLVRPYHPLVREGSHRKRAVGAVVVDRFFLLNLFDQEATCRRAWRRLLHTPHRWPEPAIRHSFRDIQWFWGEVCEAEWQLMETVGAGQAWRASGEKIKGWALTLGDALVHLQVAAPCWAEKRKKQPDHPAAGATAQGLPRHARLRKWPGFADGLLGAEGKLPCRFRWRFAEAGAGR
jgi:hypothetical protein